MINKVIFVFFTLFLVNAYLYAQPADNRKPESQFETEEKFLKAKYLLVIGKSDEAYKILDTLRKDNRDNAAILFEMSKIKFAAGEFTDAEQLIHQAVKLEPSNQWYRLYYAEMEENLAKYESAAFIYTELINIYPKNQRYYDALYNAQLKAGKYADALSTLDKMETQFGFSEQLIFKKAELYDNTGKVQDAVQQIERLVAKYPGQLKYLKLIASMLKSNGMDKEALNYYSKILEADPTDPEAQIAILASASQQSGPAAFLTSLIPMFQNTDIHIDLKIKEALPYVLNHAENGDPMLGEKLRNLGNILTITHPHEAKAHALYADILMNSGETDLAVSEYQRTLELNDRNYIVWEQYLYGLKSLQRFEDLAKASDNAIDLFPNFPLPYYFSGIAAMEKNNLTKADELLKESLNIAASDNKSKIQILPALAQLMLKEKKYKDAHTFISEAMQITGGKDFYIIEIEGDIYFAQSDIKSAISKWKESLSKGNKSERILQKLEKAGAN